MLIIFCSGEHLSKWAEEAKQLSRLPWARLSAGWLHGTIHIPPPCSPLPTPRQISMARCSEVPRMCWVRSWSNVLAGNSDGRIQGTRGALVLSTSSALEPGGSRAVELHWTGHLLWAPCQGAFLPSLSIKGPSCQVGCQGECPAVFYAAMSKSVLGVKAWRELAVLCQCPARTVCSPPAAAFPAQRCAA